MATATVTRKHPLAECETCPLARKPCAPTQGPKDAKVALVSRSPGYHEAMAGKPFSGPSGKVLDHLLALNGVKRHEILVTNTVLCAPDKGKVPPQAIKACSKRLQDEISNTSLVIAAGVEAVNSLIGRRTIDSYRGYRIERGDRVFVATNNPALVLYDDSTFPNLVKDFRRAFNPLSPPVLPTVEWTTDVDHAKSLLTRILEDDAPYRGADIESRGGLTHKAELVSVQFSTSPTTAITIGEPACCRDDIQRLLREIFGRTDCRYIWHNGKFDIKILNYRYGIPARVDEDVMLLHYAIDERTGIHDQSYLLMEELGWPNYEPDSVKKFKKTGIVTDEQELYEYAGWDAAGNHQLYDHLVRISQSDDPKHGGTFDRPYRYPLVAAVPVLAAMEMHGMVYDVEAAADLYENEVRPELDQRIHRMREILDNPIYNPMSAPQTSALYYDNWQVKHAMQARPDKERSVDTAAREELIAGRFTIPEETRAKFHNDEALWLVAKEKRTTIEAFIKEMHRFKKLQKQASTYIVSLVEQAERDPEHRIYTSLNLQTTVTGRLSSTDPNLQNITRDKDDLPSIRRLFLASPGRKLVQADYSQAELRCIAVFSGDPELTKAYEEDIDLHSLVAERFYGPNFTPEQRSNTKNMNFGVAFRQTAATFLEKHEIPVAEAEPFIKWWWEQFVAVAKWEKEIENEVRTRGYCESPFGYRRRFYLLTRENIQGAFREAINFYPQNTASSLTLTTAIEVYGIIDHSKASLCLTVHDSILADVDTGYVDEYSGILREVMERKAKEELGWQLPFKIDIGVGDNWADAK